MLEVIAPIYLTIGVGFLAVRVGLVSGEGLRALSAFVVMIALPALLFGAIARRPLTEVVQPAYLLAYAGGSLVAALVGWWAVRGLARRPASGPVDGLAADPPADPVDGLAADLADGSAARAVRMRAAYTSLGSGMSNSGFVVYPVLQLAMPGQAAVVFGMNVLVENLLMLPLGLSVAERAAGGHASPLRLARDMVGRLARQPMVIAIVAGVAFSALGLTMPTFVDRTVTLFADATPAPALFIIGGFLVGQSLRGQFGRVAPLVVGKLVAHPLAVGALTYVVVRFGPAMGVPALDPTLAAGAVISAAAPTISILPLLAARHGEGEAMSAASFACTLGAVLTLSAALLLVGPSHG